MILFSIFMHRPDVDGSLTILMIVNVGLGLGRVECLKCQKKDGIYIFKFNPVRIFNFKF